MGTPRWRRLLPCTDRYMCTLLLGAPLLCMQRYWAKFSKELDREGKLEAIATFVYNCQDADSAGEVVQSFVDEWMG